MPRRCSTPARRCSKPRRGHRRQAQGQGVRSEAVQEEARQPDIATVALDTLEHETPRKVGCERLCLKAPDDPGFAEILHELGIKGREGRIARADRRQDG